MYIKKILLKRFPEIEPLKLATGLSKSQLRNPWVLIESAYGDCSPGTVHLLELAKKVKEGILSSNYVPSLYFCTDICDGIIQGTRAMEFSLLFRDVLTMVTELHFLTGHFDGIIGISACDKSVPAHLIAFARLNTASIFLPGGIQTEGPDNITLNKIGAKNYSKVAEFICPNSGACDFLGTAATMQILSEAIGIALPGSALLPSNSNILLKYAFNSGKQISYLIKKNLWFRDIVTKESIRNALVILSAIGGSTNAIIHLAKLAATAKIEFSLDWLNEINEKVPFILDIQPSGKYSANFFWMAGGVPRLFLILKDYLNLSCVTVTGETFRNVLSRLQKEDFFKTREGFLKNYSLAPEDIIKPIDKPLNKKGSFTLLKGNIAPQGAIIKHSTLSEDSYYFKGKAVVFEREYEAIESVKKNKIKPGDCIVLRNYGPKAKGMPEVYYLTEAIQLNPKIKDKVALITDGRFSGATRGLCVGHISPESEENGPISKIKNNDIIEIDLVKKTINLISGK